MKDWTGNKKSAFTTIGAAGHANHARQSEDYYATEPKAKVEKFDVNTLQPFDKVLVRNYNNRIWEPDFFGYIKGDWVWSLQTAYSQCIPYNEETKHLCGTNNDCPEYYKWWEE